MFDIFYLSKHGTDLSLCYYEHVGFTSKLYQFATTHPRYDVISQRTLRACPQDSYWFRQYVHLFVDDMQHSYRFWYHTIWTNIYEIYSQISYSVLIKWSYRVPIILTIDLRMVILIFFWVYVLGITLKTSNWTRHIYLIAHPHLLVRATNERFPPARATFRSVLASESHCNPCWYSPLAGGPAPIGVGGVLMCLKYTCTVTRVYSPRALCTMALGQVNFIRKSTKWVYLHM